MPSTIGLVALFGQVGLAVEVDHVTRLGGFGFEIKNVMFVGRQNMRQAFRDLHTVLFELGNLLRVVGHQAHGLDLQRMEHVRGDGVIAFIVAEAKRKIRLDRIQAFVLQTVGADFVGQTDTASFLTQIQHNTLVHLADFLQRGFELVAAVTAQRANHVARQAFGMQAHGDILRAKDFALDDGDVFLAVLVV